ncbi:MAG: hypothetical protein JEZ08_00680 [Clostridiales bacterium]|nr:hypothetical protein [Clostridiales bacterium]
MIRCKRCFKKYDGYDPECPRCGKLNEIEDITRDSKTAEDERSKAHAFGEVEGKLSLKSYKCKFCGSLHSGNASNCKICFNSKIVSKKTETQVIERFKFERFIDDIYLENSEVVDYNKLLYMAESARMDLNQWEAPVSYEFGKMFSWKKLVMMAISFLFFFFIGQIKNHDSVMDDLPFALVVIGISIIFMFIKKKSYVEGINISKVTSHDESKISYFESKDGKRGNEKFIFYSFDLESVELTQNSEGHIVQIQLTEKMTENNGDEIHKIDTREFTESASFKKVILLFCLKYKIKLKIKNEYEFNHISKEEIT